jgi:hypothetical protein
VIAALSHGRGLGFESARAYHFIAMEFNHRFAGRFSNSIPLSVPLKALIASLAVGDHDGRGCSEATASVPPGTGEHSRIGPAIEGRPNVRYLSVLELMLFGDQNLAFGRRSCL